MARISLISTIGVGYMLAQNWKPLGKPEWVRPTLLLVFGIPVGGFALLIGALEVAVSLRAYWLFGMVALSFFAMNWGLAWVLMRLQKKGYQWLLSSEPKLDSTYTYDVRTAVLTWLGLVRLGGVVGVVLAILFFPKP